MSKLVCRAITLYSYHIPITESSLRAQYSTIGFFDGMSTEAIDINYREEDLKALWQYTTAQTKQCDGSYSFQNIFALADDEWNSSCTDELFWSFETDKDYPLTMVVCLQLGKYMNGFMEIRKQCEKLNSYVASILENGIAYTYCSIDKNEIIVCLKCRNYHEAVRTIQALHTEDALYIYQQNTVVYSYSVFSVNQNVLNQLTSEEYPDLYDEEIESICFKGITNSIKDEEYGLSLDRKYYDFCERLAEKLYSGGDRWEIICADSENTDDYKKDRTYDILGDDDFRYIARKVKLGKLLYEYREDGMLSYSDERFAFYLFSASLVLNTKTEPEGKQTLDDGWVQETGEKLTKSMVPKNCNDVAGILDQIFNIITEKYADNDKILSIYYALHQLLQSFKVLELSPAKRYDFFSMFPPFKMLVEIVRDKLQGEVGEKIAEQEDMFDFIHKISMTFHSAQRTDIRFFQIQDFNVIVHYAPAKLRAFYASWILQLSELYKWFKGKDFKDYSYIFAPGMFGLTRVRQLFTGGGETKRLMLVTLPDRSVFQIKRLLIVLSHEAAHVGCERQREKRHNSALEVCARAAILELHAFMMCEINDCHDYLEPDIFINMIRNDRQLLHELEDALFEENQMILRQFGDEESGNIERDNECRRVRSKVHIGNSFEKMRAKEEPKIIADYCCQIKNEYIEKKKGASGDINYLACLTEMNRDVQAGMSKLIGMFHNVQLRKILDVFYFIEEEAFADLITILTLEHSMEDYILSFTSDEIMEEDVAGRTDATAVIVRMALVIETVSKIAEYKWVSVNCPDLIKEWGREQLIELCKKFERGSIEERVTGKILCYREAVQDYLEQIDHYKRMYNVKDRGYTSTSYGFLTDLEVWNALCEYLYISAEAYVKTLEYSRNAKIYNQKRTMARTYKDLNSGTFLDAVQIIEDFLCSYEQQQVQRQEQIH